MEGPRVRSHAESYRSKLSWWSREALVIPSFSECVRQAGVVEFFPEHE